MSYILEALKKSQRDRNLGQVPDLTTEPYADPADNSTHMNPWAIGSVIIALLALLIALYGVFGRKLLEPDAAEIQTPNNLVRQLQSPEQITTSIDKQQPVSTQPPKTIQPANPVIEPIAAVVESAPDIQQTPPTSENIADQTSIRPAAVISTPEKPASRQTEVDKIRQEYAQMQVQEKQRKQQRQLQPPPQHKQKIAPEVSAITPRPATTPAAPKAHPATHELPADVLSRLPPRNIMLQSYSEDPAQRFVILNSLKLHQGEGTADGLQVLEIRVDGLLLGFEGYQFLQTR